MNLIGHTHIVDYFTKVLARNALSHAYLFVGPRQIGKETLVRSIAARLFETTPEKLATQPDFFLLTQTQDEKTGKTKRDISIEQIRELTQFLSQSPLLKSQKIAIIDGAEKMSIGAGNALLKTLEEPRGDTHLFLLTTDEEKVAATVRSRCQKIILHPVPKVVLIEGLKAAGASVAIAAEYAEKAQGKPGAALTWLNDPDAYEAREKEAARFFSLIGKPFHAKLQAVEQLFDKKQDHIAARQNLIEVLAIWQAACSDIIHGKTQTPVTQKQLTETYKELMNATNYLEDNVHPRLLVEHILLALP